MSKVPILINFRIGRSVGKYNAGSSTGTADFVDAISKESVELAKAQTRIDMMKLLPKLKASVETGFAQAIQYAAKNMIGRVSPRAWGVDPKPVPVSVQFRHVADWRPLSLRTIREQRALTGAETTGKGNFFLQTGALRNELRTMARQMVKKTGVVKAEVRNVTTGDFVKPNLKTSKTVPVANLRLTLLPNIYPSQLPGLRSGNLKAFNPDMTFEKALGLSESAITKLAGPTPPGQPRGLYHRPMLQPVFTFWALNEIPKRIGEVLFNSIADREKVEGL